MIQKQQIWLIPAAALVLAFAACNTGSDDNGSTDNGNDLPPVTGTNELSGKTFIGWSSKIVFSTTGEGAANGTFKNLSPQTNEKGQSVLKNNKYVFEDSGNGDYTWDQTKKTVTLKPETLALTFARGDTRVLDKAGYRAALKEQMDKAIEGMTEAQLNEALKEQGFSSIDAYIDYEVNEGFKNRTYNYAFSSDAKKILFMDEALPENKGENELSGNTYSRVTGDGTLKYVFTPTVCTVTYTYGDGYSNDYTYTYAYDANEKRVYLKEVVPGPDRNTYYQQVAGNTTTAGNFDTADEYNAARVNSQYDTYIQRFAYDTAAKTLKFR